MNSDFEHLNMIFQSSKYEGESNKPSKCDNCEVLQANVKYLVKTSSKLAMGTANLNVVMGSQYCVFDKAEIGFKLVFRKKKNRKFSSFFKHSKKQASPFQTYFHCFHKGHSSRTCRIRLFDVPNGLVRWVPKVTFNSFGPKFNRLSIFKN